MERAKTFTELIVWQKAHALALASYVYSKGFPREEVFGLTSQFRRSTVSVAASIAEGFARRTERDKIRMLNIAQGSLSESKYYLILARDLGYGDPKKLVVIAEETSKLLTAFIKSLEKNLS